jgi:GNAT superfamily N-acetyltransferase
MAYLAMLLRPARPEDALAVAGVHVRSWQAAYRGLLPDEYLDGLRPEERAARYDFTHIDPQVPHTIVAVQHGGNEDGAILGFATTGPSRDTELEHWGELCALYVDPPHWNKGIGAALVRAAREHLASRGFRDAYLWVLAGNLRANRFYGIDGWAHDGTRRTDVVWGATVDELRYRRRLELD